MCKGTLHPVTSPSFFPCYLPHLCSFGAENFIFLFFKAAGTSQILTQKQQQQYLELRGFVFCFWWGKPVPVPLQKVVLHWQRAAADAALPPQLLPQSSHLPAQACRVLPVHPARVAQTSLVEMKPQEGQSPWMGGGFHAGKAGARLREESPAPGVATQMRVFLCSKTRTDNTGN